jgi:hypothetical protein
MNEGPNYVALVIIVALASVPAAFMLNGWQREKHPDLLPYKWGYYCGCTGTFSYSVFAILQFLAALDSYGSRSKTLFLLSMVFAVATSVHVAIIKRHKWAFVLGTILSLNPLLWVINGIYIRNRWSELIDLPRIFGSRLENISLVGRAIIFGSVFWAFAVLVFVFLFEPYGSYMSDSDWLHVLKIVLFPPLLAFVGRLLFVKVIKQDR